MCSTARRHSHESKQPALNEVSRPTCPRDTSVLRSAAIRQTSAQVEVLAASLRGVPSDVSTGHVGDQIGSNQAEVSSNRGARRLLVKQSVEEIAFDLAFR